MTFQNQYYIMRHGQSKANVAGLIVSYPENGLLDDYGLTDLGKTQALEQLKTSELPPNTIIYSSDFSRTTQTAQVAKDYLGTEHLYLVPHLRERPFGEFELSENAYDNYPKVWALDAQDPDHTEHGVASVNETFNRVFGFIEELEDTHQGETILLVSHGDPSQILLTYFEGKKPHQHRDVNHLETAEIRKLN